VIVQTVPVAPLYVVRAITLHTTLASGSIDCTGVSSGIATANPPHAPGFGMHLAAWHEA
jgi:hypothetical protein